MLIGLPLLIAGGLSFWLGVPEENHDTNHLFERLQLTEVALAQKDSLQYGNLFFCKVQIEKDSLPAFLHQLESLETSTGPTEKPIALKLERPWWDPPHKTEGTYWRQPAVTLWSPKGSPGLFYAVAKVDGAGEEPAISNTP